MSRQGDRKASAGGSGAANEAFDRSMASLSAQLADRFARNPPANNERMAALHEENSRPGLPRSRLIFGLLAVSFATAVAVGAFAFFPATAPPSPAPPTVAAATMPSPPPATDTRPAILDPAPPPPVRAEPIAPPSPPSPSPPQTIDIPLDRGEILDVQTRLKALGLYPGPLDGVAGPMTVTAATRYAQSRGRSSTGAVDRELLRALQQESR